MRYPVAHGLTVSLAPAIPGLTVSVVAISDRCYRSRTAEKAGAQPHQRRPADLRRLLHRAPIARPAATIRAAFEATRGPPHRDSGRMSSLWNHQILRSR